MPMDHPFYSLKEKNLEIFLIYPHFQFTWYQVDNQVAQIMPYINPRMLIYIFRPASY